MGIRGNDLARKGSGLMFISPEPESVLGISLEVIRECVSIFFRNKQHCDWCSASANRQAKELNHYCPSLCHKELIR